MYNSPDKLKSGLKELNRRLTQTTLNPNDERRIIKEIELVEKSEPIFAEIDKIKVKINDKKKEKQEIYDNLAPTNKIINALKAEISKVKQNESKFENSRQDIKYQMTNINTELDKIQEKIKITINQRYEIKQDFYGKMCDYEIQQLYIKDVEWIKKTKTMVMEREERRSRIDAERKERKEI